MARSDRDRDTTRSFVWAALFLSSLAVAWRIVPGMLQVAATGRRKGRGRPATPPSPAARGAGHETEEMSGALMGKLVLLLGVVATCMVFAMVGLRIWLHNTTTTDRPALTALQTAPITPPEPHLQADPLAEIARLHAAEDKLLHGYAYIDPARTRARIPIDRAMALMVGRGLQPAP